MLRRLWPLASNEPPCIHPQAPGVHTVKHHVKSVLKWPCGCPVPCAPSPPQSKGHCPACSCQTPCALTHTHVDSVSVSAMAPAQAIKATSRCPALAWVRRAATEAGVSVLREGMSAWG